MHIHHSISAILAKQRAADLDRTRRPRLSTGFWADVAPAASIVVGFTGLLAFAHPYL